MLGVTILNVFILSALLMNVVVPSLGHILPVLRACTIKLLRQKSLPYGNKCKIPQNKITLSFHLFCKIAYFCLNCEGLQNCKKCSKNPKYDIKFQKLHISRLILVFRLLNLPANMIKIFALEQTLQLIQVQHFRLTVSSNKMYFCPKYPLFR